MEKLIPYGICALLFIVGIKGSIENSIYEGNLKYSLNRMLYYMSIFIAFIGISLNLSNTIKFIVDLGNQWFQFNGRESEIFRILSLIIIYFIIQFIVYSTLKLVFKIIFNSENKLNKFKLILFSTIFGILKGSIAILIMFIGIITYNITIGTQLPLNIFENVKTFAQIESIIIKSKPSMNYVAEENILPTSNVLIYYNGVTLEDGIRSNEEINYKAKELTKVLDTDREKARSLYVWVGSNLKYDFDKAERALSNENTGNSGAIEAWNTRLGICFDYSCLYVAMAREVGLQVRLITGRGFDGKQYGPHAWNEVYLEDEGKWIPVDTTFYLSGNYFDNEDFYQDHIKEGIAGEW